MFLVTFRFFVFLAAAIAAYYIVPGRFQWMVLLGASAVFYFLAGTPYTVVYLLVTVVTVWAAGRAIGRWQETDPRRAKRALLSALVVNGGILAALKYTNFFLSNFRAVGSLFGVWQGIPLVRWTASLGVSFYSLQAIGYLLDVYWGTSKPQENLFKVALFVSYFPQMSSGPISRYHQLDGQLYQPHRFDYQRLCFGLQRMMIGFTKKLVVAENLAGYVSVIFQDDANYNGWFIWLGIAGYLVQLYADFSGCMDIVLGASECFGVRMPENFDRPFHSRSIQEFWKRWHITLGAWVQDYILFPILHSKRWGKLRKYLKKKYGKAAAKNVPTYLAMLVLWLFMGLWHGGAWRYVTQGVLFWLIIMLGQLMEKPFRRALDALYIDREAPWWQRFQSIRTTFLFGVGVVFFRASGVRRAFHYIKSAFSPRCLLPGNFLAQLGVYRLAVGKKDAVCAAFGLIVMFTVILFEAKGVTFYEWLAKRNLLVRWVILYGILFGIILFGVYGPQYNASEFIYGGF